MLNLLKKIEHLSENYMRDVKQGTRSFISAKGDKEKILSSWWFSLVFFLDRVFYQGRRDEVSYIFEQVTINALEELLGETDKQKLDKLIWLRDHGCLNYRVYRFHSKEEVGVPSPCSVLREKLNKKYLIQLPRGSSGERSTGKSRDREMTVDTLCFISKNLEKYDYNILKYAIFWIKNNEIKSLYDELRTIRQVGDKTASLFLRDVVAVYGLENQVEIRDYILLQPIDTWVRQISRNNRLSLASKGTRDEELKNKIVKACLDRGISPIKFNQGIWYLGSHSLELILSGFSLQGEDC